MKKLNFYLIKLLCSVNTSGEEKIISRGMLLKLPLCFYILLYKTIHSFVQKIALFCTKEIILLYKDIIKSRLLF
jgi:hypothetical protein